ncbi:MAG TPA: HAMP domain-containing sensor histidine kinase, partial [Myxococcales bacterium]|nr:HAMP domain-containing sensor histidine kinase [Myxococcales bacterium]
MARPRRLYLRLYLAFLGVLLAVLAVSIGVTAVFGRGPFHFLFRQAPRFAEHLGRALPPLDDAAALKRTLEQFHEELGMDAIVIDPRGTPLASAGTPIPVPDPEVLASAHRGASWVPRPPLLGAPVRARRGAPVQGVLIVRLPPEGARAILRPAIWLLVVLLVSSALIYPLSRSITRPIERLTAAAETFGRGNLSARSGVKSDDEVGTLARSFDEMAGRIQAARRAEKELLANVSHELRTPLARINVALELIQAPDPNVRKRLSVVGEELEELERLIADVLTTSRLELAQAPLDRRQFSAAQLVEKGRQRVLALEPERPVQAQVQPGLQLIADESLLSRALDNLLDNARKYGGGPRNPIQVEAR